MFSAPYNNEQIAYENLVNASMYIHFECSIRRIIRVEGLGFDDQI